jgi:hypothetical protein
MTALPELLEAENIAEAARPSEVRHAIYTKPRAYFDQPARIPRGRRLLRRWLGQERAVLRKPQDWTAEDLVWSEWVVARITKALNAHKRTARRVRCPRTSWAIEAAERIEHLIGSLAWDEHKKRRSQHVADAREACYLAGELRRRLGGGA